MGSFHVYPDESKGTRLTPAHGRDARLYTLTRRHARSPERLAHAFAEALDKAGRIHGHSDFGGLLRIMQAQRVADGAPEALDDGFEGEGGFRVAVFVEGLYGGGGVEDGGVVTLEGAPDVGGGGRGELAAEEDGQLPGRGNLLFAALADEIIDADAELVADGLLDVGAGEAEHGLLLLDIVAEDCLFQDFDGDGALGVAREHARVVDGGGKGALERADAAADALRDELDHGLAEGDVRIGAQLQQEDVQACLVGGDVHVGGDAALETGDQTVHQVRHEPGLVPDVVQPFAGSGLRLQDVQIGADQGQRRLKLVRHIGRKLSSQPFALGLLGNVEHCVQNHPFQLWLYQMLL